MDAARLESKVLVLENDPECAEQLKRFCDANALIGLKAQPDNVMSVLKSNIDLGGIFLAEDFGATQATGVALAHAIHTIRPELPIFLRCSSPRMLNGADARVVRATYAIQNIESIAPVIAESIFSLVYPNTLVRGIGEITVAALTAQFKDVEVSGETPYIVRDRIIYGELFTLIPLESNWCRGYMMLQVEENAMRGVLGLTQADSSEQTGLDFRDLNNALGEATNLIWGAFKNRYIAYSDSNTHLTQIPIVINHGRRYMSFGSDDPQLCFRYTLTDLRRPDAPPVHVYQRFIFNLSWSPDDFKENQTSIEGLVESGELELF